MAIRLAPPLPEGRIATDGPYAGRELLPLLSIVYETPSKHNPWRWPLRPGERITDPQLAWLQRAGIAPADAEMLTVYSPSTWREIYCPAGTPSPVFEFPCPVIRRRDAEVMVVTPDGSERWVNADGTIPSGHRRRPRRF
ncbi:MAG: hypothetical protein QHC65_06570 [Sphingomonas sp.]|nr:hypothetical protein [Sphingomonas sp.]MDX3884067.1 hypothetical protein [Sphingomonas sp.]